MDDDRIWVLEHSRSVAAEGRKMLMIMAATSTALADLPPLAFSQMWTDERAFSVAWIVILAVVTLLGAIIGIRNARSAGTFFCRLSCDRLECHCPVAGCGETFTLATSEIEKVERDDWGESYRLYVRDRAGRRYWLTDNYGNPADRFVELILANHPEVQEKDRT